LSDVELEHIQTTARSHKISPTDIQFTGYVSDADLVCAYNLCRLFVFPSWHEGFGLPPLEAMACGAVVIASNTSSLPEVMGLDEAMFDPLSVESISAKILQALTDEQMRQKLVQHGLAQAKKFSWDLTARAALQAFEEIWIHHVDRLIAQRPWNEVWQRQYELLIKALASRLHSLDAVTKVDIDAVAACIDFNEQMAAGITRTDLLPARLHWRLEGPFDSSYSLALVNREFARALASLGHDVALHSSEGGGDFPANPAFLSANPDLQSLNSRASTMASSQLQVLSRFMYPPRVHDMDARINLLHCYGWEESLFPADWVEKFNAHLNGITVMSQHVAKLLIDSGVRVPIAVTGIGVDHWERIQMGEGFTLEAKTFRFLHVSSCFPRKGVEELLRAYGLAFRAHDDVTLVIKTFVNPHNDIHRWLSEIRASDATFPDVLVLEEDFSDAQLKSLYLQCQALVAPSRAEGFGLPLAEAMLSGLAVITTAWSGQLDFCTNDTAWLVNFDFVLAKSHFELSDSVWAQADVHHLAQTLLQVQRLPEEARLLRANAGRALLLSKFTWQHIAQKAEYAVRRWALQGSTKEPCVAWVSSWNTRCGIASYSAHLLAHMPSQVHILASHAEISGAQDEVHVHRCWHQGDEDSLENLTSAVELVKADTVVIQFNYGFFDLPTLSTFLHQQIDAGRTVLVEMHSTSDPLHVPHKKLTDMLPALRRCHRIFVHSVADMNRLKVHGLLNNVALFPHGILDRPAREEKPSGDRPFRIASYGYFLPHKGLLELIDAVVSLRVSGALIELLMVNAQYPAPISIQAIAQARDKIADSQAETYITLQSDYLDDERSLDYLSGADLIVFPYQETGESASGAVRFGIACGAPVAVTPLSIFDDVNEAVHLLPGTSVEHIAHGINTLMRDIRCADPQITAKAEQCARWRADHRYSKLSARFANMLSALHLENSSNR
jgi:glycosyltransferase involved in cell wall biosynthesis